MSAHPEALRASLVALLALALCGALACSDPATSDNPGGDGPDVGLEDTDEPDAAEPDADDPDATEPDADDTPDADEGACVEDADCGRDEACRQGACLSVMRLVTWNLQQVGAPDSEEFAAALAVLRRLGAELVALQEINGAQDVENFQRLAAEAGYPHVLLAGETVFGSQRNAVLSTLPLEVAARHTAASLSGDPNAQDITRELLEVRVSLPGRAPLTVWIIHAKSGATNNDEFRQVCEAVRLGQALERRFDPARDAVAVVGDFNEDIFTGTRTPERFTEPPDGLPDEFQLGADLSPRLRQEGFLNNPFFHLQRPDGPALEALDAEQPDGTRATRPESGRRIDYILVSPRLAAHRPAVEIFDAQDEALGGLPKRPPALAPETTTVASDHLPVVVDLLLD